MMKNSRMACLGLVAVLGTGLLVVLLVMGKSTLTLPLILLMVTATFWVDYVARATSRVSERLAAMEKPKRRRVIYGGLIIAGWMLVGGAALVGQLRAGNGDSFWQNTLLNLATEIFGAAVTFIILGVFWDEFLQRDEERADTRVQSEILRQLSEINSRLDILSEKLDD